MTARGASQRRWLPAEEAFLCRNADTPRPALLERFNELFSPPITRIAMDRKLASLGVEMSPDAKKTRLGGGHNRMPIGTERKFRGGRIYVRTETGWVPKHKMQWEAVNGPMPEGHVLVPLDDSRETWTCIPAGASAQLSMHSPVDAPSSELRPALIALAQLKHAIRSKQ